VVTNGNLFWSCCGKRILYSLRFTPKNWARIVLLAMFLLSEVSVSVTRLMWPTALGDEDFWSAATTSAYFVIDSVALYWLFSGAGARWYAAKEA
jgi:hypothetical protein